MNRTQKLTLISESTDLLSSRSSEEINLILEQFGCKTEEFWDSDRYKYCMSKIKALSDKDLSELHKFLTGGQPDDPLDVQPWEDQKLKLFISHLAKHRSFVGEVKQSLIPYGIDAFVAHDSIKPSNEWVDVIEAALGTCDAAIAFLHDGFQNSPWCDQEIGYILARRVPVLPLMFEIQPYGFLGKYQSARCIHKIGEKYVSYTPAEVTRLILEWLGKTPATEASFTECLVSALENSISWDRTRLIWPWLSERPSFTPDQLRRVEAAAKNNVDVREAFIGMSSAPDRIRQLIKEKSEI